MQRNPHNRPIKGAIDLRRRRLIPVSESPSKTFEYILSGNFEAQINKVRVVVEKSQGHCFLPVKAMVEATEYEGYNGEIVVLGYNVSEPFATFRNRFPNAKIICYQLEQIFNNQSWWYDVNSKAATPVRANTDHINGWLQGCDEIWDYDLDNIEFLASLGYKNIKFKPMQWFDGINNITHVEKDIDVLFYGGINAKRSAHLDLLHGYNHKVITQNFQAWGETLNEYIGRSKIILNLHHYDSHIQEQVRIFSLVANDCCVLSEESRRNYFGELIQHFEPGKLKEKIDWLLTNNNWEKVSQGIGDKFKTKTMLIAVCLIIKDEGQYLEEWLNHYIKLGVDHFYIYDNESKIPVIQTIMEIPDLPAAMIDVIEWHDNATGSQNRAYLDCARKNPDYNYIGFLDTDEFYMSKGMDIKRDFWDLEKVHGKNDALGFYWRIYGQPEPYLQERQPADAYTKWFPFNHIKSFVRPNAIINFPDPHKANIEGRYIDELGRKVERPIGEHTSHNIWIKHIYTRSVSEWKEKIERGSGDKVYRYKTMEEFYNYNNQCINE